MKIKLYVIKSEFLSYMLQFPKLYESCLELAPNQKDIIFEKLSMDVLYERLVKYFKQDQLQKNDTQITFISNLQQVKYQIDVKEYYIIANQPDKNPMVSFLKRIYRNCIEDRMVDGLKEE